MGDQKRACDRCGWPFHPQQIKYPIAHGEFCCIGCRLPQDPSPDEVENARLVAINTELRQQLAVARAEIESWTKWYRELPEAAKPA